MSYSRRQISFYKRENARRQHNGLIYEYCNVRHTSKCCGTCSQPGMPDCPYLIWAELEKEKRRTK